MNSKLTRRGVMGLTAGAGLAACAAPETISGKTSSVLGMGTFAHGVASGDPFTTSVVLWTHIATEHDGDIAGTWEISKDTDFDNVTVSDSFVTNKSRDYCVKIIADTLEPGQTYFYRFRVGNTVSDLSLIHI